MPQEVSILKYAQIADAGKSSLTVQQVRVGHPALRFRPMNGNFGNLGFTNHNFWLRFELLNALNIPLTYYLETAEPITNHADLYLFDAANQMQVQRSGDDLNISDRALPYRKTLFKITINPGEKKTAFLEVKNDGEKNTLPLNLKSEENLLKEVYHEQLIMGLFYGILFMVSVTYLFFYFALKESIFLYYSLYVLFTSLCHAALDGFLHEYILQERSWFNLHAVLLFAIGGSYFFGRYSEIVLDLKKNNILIHYAFKALYLLFALVLLGLVLFPSFLSYAYPIVNILTLIGMLLIFSAIIYFWIKGQPMDMFYVFGISILFVCITMVILLNFGYSYNSIFLDNISKIGIAMEVIALSLSMANRIRLLKSKKEELQTIALQRLKEMNETKSHFLSNMSHELRTPLNAIIGLANLMDNEIQNPELSANFKMIKQASGTLVSAVNDILDFSMIEKGELQLDHLIFSPVQVVDMLRLRFEKMAEEKGLTFNFYSSADAADLIIGDPVRLEQILNNILNNALKFTLKGEVSFVIVPTLADDDQLELKFTISDTGVGIPPEKLENIFHIFSQVEVDNKRRFGGFGIGLCVVKALVDLHSGEIELQSTLLQGTVCNIKLRYPKSKAIVKTKNIFPVDRYDLLNRRVLVVEDNPMNQMVLKMMFKKWDNISVCYASNGQEALTLLQEQPVDIILMDLQMPVMDGYEAIAAIRSGDLGYQIQQLPIIAITADLMHDARERVFKLGVNDYMTKPIDRQLLYEKMTAHLS